LASKGAGRWWRNAGSTASATSANNNSLSCGNISSVKNTEINASGPTSAAPRPAAYGSIRTTKASATATTDNKNLNHLRIRVLCPSCRTSRRKHRYNRRDSHGGIKRPSICCRFLEKSRSSRQRGNSIEVGVPSLDIGIDG
jgi:hypothetical protein